MLRQFFIRHNARARAAVVARVTCQPIARAAAVERSPLARRLFDVMHGGACALPHDRADVAAVLAAWQHASDKRARCAGVLDNVREMSISFALWLAPFAIACAGAFVAVSL